MEIEIDLR